MRRDVFQAIADPTRRAILGKLAAAPQNLNTIAEQFRISRPAISRHIKILAECGLVALRQEGRERYCQARLEKLAEVNDWLAPYRVFWNGRLDALGNFLETPAHTKKSTKKRSR